MSARLGVKEVAYTLARRRCPYFKLKPSIASPKKHSKYKKEAARSLQGQGYTILGGAGRLPEAQVVMEIPTSTGRVFVEGKPDIVVVKGNQVLVVEVKSSTHELLAPLYQLSLYFIALEAAVGHQGSINQGAQGEVVATGSLQLKGGRITVTASATFPLSQSVHLLGNARDVGASLALPAPVSPGKSTSRASIKFMSIEPQLLEGLAEGILDYVVTLRPVEEKAYIPGPYCTLCDRADCPWRVVELNEG
jgi:Holliday junction resolvase-like predicted endonuclease